MEAMYEMETGAQRDPGNKVSILLEMINVQDLWKA
jgi:hypothetical protein